MKGSLLILIIFFSGVQLVNAGCVKSLNPTTPSSYFQAKGDVIYDHTTGLVWQRCASGQHWDEKTQHCKLMPGKEFSFNWKEALELAKTLKEKGWRIPNRVELLSLVERACAGPAINESLFPDTPYRNFWSQDVPRALPDHKWVVNFKVGSLATINNSEKISLRLVMDYQ